MTRTQDFTDTLSVHECSNCGCTYGITTAYERDRRKDHKTWYCPNGCARHYPQKNVEEQLRAELARTEGQVAVERTRAQEAEREAVFERNRARALKGHLTRARRRAAAGICPCCKRSFKQVRDHMQGQHPDEYARIFGEGD